MQPGDPRVETAEDYLAGLHGWQRETVAALRLVVLAAAPLEERIKWGHLVYFSEGPVLLIRAEPERVLFGFWRGKRLREIEARLKPGGRFEMATVVLRQGDTIAAQTIRRLVAAAIDLNAIEGDPTPIARPLGPPSPKA